MTTDKKKTVMLIALGAVLVAVGAFQFAPRGTASTAGTAKNAAKPADAGKPGAETGGQVGEEDPQREFLLALVNDPLQRRDPFKPQTSEAPVVEPDTVATEKAPPRAAKPAWRPQNRFVPPPIDPLPGPLSGGGGIGLENAPPLRQPNEFAFKVKGVLVGKRPMAVFEDDNGNQRLVPLGGSIGTDSKVVGIERGKVRIRHRGQEKTLQPLEGQ